MEITENRVNVLVIEKPDVMAEVIDELYKQVGGEEGMFVLSENFNIMKFSKEVMLILEPFSVDVNDKKFIAKLHNQLKEYAVENMPMAMAQLGLQINGYVENVCRNLPYNTVYKVEYEPLSIFKLADVKFNVDATTLLEKIVEYIGLAGKLCGVRVVIFLNLKNFLSEQNLAQLYEYAFYNKINLILLEYRYCNKCENEDIIIIDKDRCVIKF